MSVGDPHGELVKPQYPGAERPASPAASFDRPGMRAPTRLTRPRSAGSILAGVDRPGGEDLPLVFAGSLEVSSSGLAGVAAIAARSEIG